MSGSRPYPLSCNQLGRLRPAVLLLSLSVQLVTCSRGHPPAVSVTSYTSSNPACSNRFQNHLAASSLVTATSDWDSTTSFVTATSDGGLATSFPATEVGPISTVGKSTTAGAFRGVAGLVAAASSPSCNHASTLLIAFRFTIALHLCGLGLNQALSINTHNMDSTKFMTCS